MVRMELCKSVIDLKNGSVYHVCREKNKWEKMETGQLPPPTPPPHPPWTMSPGQLPPPNSLTSNCTPDD